MLYVGCSLVVTPFLTGVDQLKYRRDDGNFFLQDSSQLLFYEWSRKLRWNTRWARRGISGKTISMRMWTYTKQTWLCKQSRSIHWRCCHQSYHHDVFQYLHATWFFSCTSELNSPLPIYILSPIPESNKRVLDRQSACTDARVLSVHAEWSRCICVKIKAMKRKLIANFEIMNSPPKGKILRVPFALDARG